MEGSGGAGRTLSCFGIFLPHWDKRGQLFGFQASRRLEQQVPSAPGLPWGCPWLLLPGGIPPIQQGSCGPGLHPWHGMWGWKAEGTPRSQVRELGESPAELIMGGQDQGPEVPDVHMWLLLAK